MITSQQTFRITGAISLLLEHNNNFDVDMNQEEQREIAISNWITTLIYYDFNENSIFELVDVIDRTIYRIEPTVKILVSTMEALFPVIDEAVEALDNIKLDDQNKVMWIENESRKDDLKDTLKKSISSIDSFNNKIDLLKEKIK